MTKIARLLTLGVSITVGSIWLICCHCIIIFALIMKVFSNPCIYKYTSKQKMTFYLKSFQSYCSEEKRSLLTKISVYQNWVRLQNPLLGPVNFLIVINFNQNPAMSVYSEATLVLKFPFCTFLSTLFYGGHFPWLSLKFSSVFYGDPFLDNKHSE